MSFHTVPLVIIIPAGRLAAANAYMKRHGYGADNFRRAIIRATDPDSQAARGYVATFQADAGLLAAVRIVRNLDQTNIIIIAGRGARKRARQLLTARGYRLKP